MKKVWMLCMALVLALTPAALAEAGETAPVGVTELRDGMEIDLNGDGTAEKIAFSQSMVDADVGRFTLAVNDQQASGEGFCLTGKVICARLNEWDKSALLLVEEAGMSDDYACYAYWWDGARLTDVGVLPSAASTLRAGDNVLTGYVRADVLQTWFRPADYAVAHTYRYDDESDEWLDSPTLCETPRYLYPVNTVVTLKAPLTAKMGQSDDSPAFTVKAGEKLLINASDDRQWLFVSIPWARDGEQITQGWVQVRGMEVLADAGWTYSWELMDGLMMVD